MQTEENCLVCEQDFITTPGPDGVITCICEECLLNAQTRKPKTVDGFHRAFRYLLYRDDVFALLEEAGCGWLDGGCRSLMKALAKWLGEQNISYYQIVKQPDDKHSEHALIRVGEYFIDGDGISTYDQLFHRWITEELVGIKNGILYIQEFNPLQEPIHEPTGDIPFYIEEEKIQALADKLKESFDKEHIIALLEERV